MVRFVALNKILDRLQQVKAKTRRVGEELVPLRGLKNPRRKTFLDQVCAGPVLVFVDGRQALSLDLQQRPRRGGPPKYSSKGQVKDVMKAIVVFRKMVVGQAI